MDIWEILGISPVKDKRLIKKAYAARSREIHPEEQPEEFMRLYEAYRMALRYVESAAHHKDSHDSFRWSGEEDRERESSGGERFDQGELAACCEELREERGKKVTFFLESWKMVKEECVNPEVRMWWKYYLRSKEFQEIQWHPGFVEFLSEDMERQLSDDYVIRQYFWDAYGFGDDGEENYMYQGSLQKLRMALYPAYERRMNTWRLQDRALREMQLIEREDKSRRVIFWIVCLLVLLFALYGFWKV